MRLERALAYTVGVVASALLGALVGLGVLIIIYGAYELLSWLR